MTVVIRTDGGGGIDEYRYSILLIYDNYCTFQEIQN